MKPQMLCFTLTLLLCFAIPLTATAQIVNIADPDIWLTVTDIVGKPPGSAVTVADMRSILELETTGAEIVNLAGLEYAINMTWLNLTDNLIANLSPLRGLTNLEVLGLGDNLITNISHLSGLRNLTALFLWENAIVNISALRGLTNLTTLELADNSIVNISPLQGLTRLEILYLQKNNITNISALRGLINLTELNLTDNNIADISPLVANTGLGIGDEINLSGNPLDYVSRQVHVPTLRTRGVVVAVDATPITTNWAEDVNGDGVVNIIDLILVAANYGWRGQNPADVNGDGVVNMQDLIAVATVIDAAAAPAAQPQDRETIAQGDVEGWLAQAEGIDLTDPRLQEGVRFLKQLRTSLLPKVTALLPNYPNPFNPETWIPYHLAHDGDVTLTIYDTHGDPIRRFDLGHQGAGRYTDRNRAIYWDGRTDAGETVSSGVYFYQLSVGDYSQTRKMLILK